jgi:hypothetical protein
VTSLAYAASFLALAALTGFAATRRGSWLARLPLLAATPVLAIAVWWQLQQQNGWPTGGRPVDGSVFVAGVVQSPAPGSNGAIYLWTTPPGATKPRAYRLPYNRRLEKEVASAARASRAGQKVAIRAPKSAKPQGAGGPQAAGAHLRFYRLPAQGLQQKERS